MACELPDCFPVSSQLNNTELYNTELNDIEVNDTELNNTEEFENNSTNKYTIKNIKFVSNVGFLYGNNINEKFIIFTEILKSVTPVSCAFSDYWLLIINKV
jgi:hypothetical protein